MCRLTGTEPSFLLHPLDLMGGDQAPALRSSRAWIWRAYRKVELFTRVLRILGEHFRLVDMSTHARAILARRAPALRPALPPVAAPRAASRQRRCDVAPDHVRHRRHRAIATARRWSAPCSRDMADAIRHRGPDGEGYFIDGPVGFYHKRLVDHRSGDRRTADDRGAADDRLQRRDLQLRRAARRAAAARPRLPHDVRYGSHSGHVRGVRAELRQAAQRHVRVPAVRSGPADRVRRARSLRHQAAVLPVSTTGTCSSPRRSRRCCGTAVTAARRPRCDPRLSHLPVRHGRGHAVRGHPQGAPGALSDDRPGLRATRRTRALLGAAIRHRSVPHRGVFRRRGASAARRRRFARRCGATCRSARISAVVSIRAS